MESIVCKCANCNALLTEESFQRIRGKTFCRFCGAISADPSRKSEEQDLIVIAYDHIRNFAFQKAMRTFEELERINPSSQDAYWGYLQAYYGIIYLRGEGEKTPKPTYCCPQDRICDLPDPHKHDKYKKLMELARLSPEEQELYRERIGAIASEMQTLRRDIAQKEAYDVFICAKISPIEGVTDVIERHPETGEMRTAESRIAREIYARLTGKSEAGGSDLRAFFSEVSVSGGIHYDRTIWSAMLRSRYILVIGTQKEHLMSTWVRSEWERWMYLVDQGVKEKDSFIAYIPDPERWMLIRPDQWDASRVQIQRTQEQILAWIGRCEQQRCALPERDIATDRGQLLRDARALLLQGHYQEADELIEPALRRHPGDGELQFLRLRGLTENFTFSPVYLEDSASFCCGLLREAGVNYRKNPEYIAYRALCVRESAAKAEKMQESLRRQQQERSRQQQEQRRRMQERRRHQWERCRGPLIKIGGIALVAVLSLALLWGGWLLCRDSVYLEIAESAYRDQNYEKAYTYYLKVAESGDATAQAWLGYCYYNGKGVDRDYAKAVEWYIKAAEQGNASAQNNLGTCYYNGEGVDRDYAKAVECYTKAAEQGNASAQNSLGYCYNHGEGVDRDYAKALEWYTKAAEQGDANAQNNLGNCYYHGEGVDRDYAKAVEWYIKAAEQGNASAQNTLGICYYYGRGVDRDYAKAVEWLTKAAEPGYAKAQNNLGNCYYYGRGVDRDYAKALEWYTKAAEQGHAKAQNNLGYCYYHGKGVDRDYAKAVEWYTKAAEQGDANAQNNLGTCYYNGEGVEQDYAKAAEWYTKAAVQGDAEAQVNLGTCYYNGRGVAQDYTRAVEWFQKAVAQGNAAAQNWLGYCYEKGNGVEQSDTKAVEWYQKAVAQDYANAKYRLGLCYYDGRGVAQDYTRAAAYFAEGAEQNEAAAQYRLGYCYEKGLGVGQDQDTAIAWYTKAAEQGNQNAIDALERLQ